MVKSTSVGGGYFSTTTNDKSYMYYSNSIVKSSLDSWYQTNIVDKGYSDNVATGNYYCEQAKVALDSSHITNSGANMTVYSSYAPNFKCSTDANGKGLVNASIGLITYDEVVHAGGYYNKANSNYYLYQAASNYTMSPAGLVFMTSVSKYYPYVWRLDGDTLRSDMSMNSATTFPVINLKSDVEVTGTGTSTDPYKIPEPAEYQLPSKTYTAGESVTWAGLDWYVISDAGTQTTMILKTNYATGAFGSSTTFANSTAYTIVNTLFVNANSKIASAIAEGSVVSQGTHNSSSYYVRLPEQSELSTSIPNDSNTAFWTKTVNSTGLYFANDDGSQGTSYVSGTTTCYAGADTGLLYGNVAPKVQYYSLSGSYQYILPTATSVKNSYSKGSTYCSATSVCSEAATINYCTTSGASTRKISVFGCYASTNGCTKRTTYNFKSSNLGYRPVITIIEN